jgi:hypothetical protein
LTEGRVCGAMPRPMENPGEFERLVSAVLIRFFEQNGRGAPSVATVARCSENLLLLIAERGLPRPLGREELGAPGGMSEDECAPLVGRVVAGTDHEPLLADAARQLVKACFYPEFKVCRDSFREVARDGSCRRQQPERVRGRISGAHCVDCPHWVAHEPDQHAELVAREWHGAVEEFTAHRDLFLPEDFRALRQWLHAKARQ